jgi:Ca-activated chloride channel homolog
MVFLWPALLYLLFAIPIIIGVYILMVRRRRRFAVRYSSLALVRAAQPQHSWMRRHLPFALFLLALASLLVALGRPGAIVSVPTNQTAIILTMDVSGSMRSMDIQPNRLVAAEKAALAFIQNQKATAQIGIVAFSGFAEEIQQPTTDQEALQAAVLSLTTGRATAIGSGILRSLDAIAEVDKMVAPSVLDPTSALEPDPVLKGVYAPDIIVLLTDGVSNAGPDPLDAAQQAVDRGVRIYTIGFGTANGFVDLGPEAFGGGQQGGSGGFGGNNLPNGGQQTRGRFRTAIDEVTLQKIADMTGGKYYYATSASELQSVFNSLPTSLISRHEVMELSVAFSALGAVLAAAAIILSLLWHPLN